MNKLQSAKRGIIRENYLARLPFRSDVKKNGEFLQLLGTFRKFWENNHNYFFLLYFKSTGRALFANSVKFPNKGFQSIGNVQRSKFRKKIVKIKNESPKSIKII